MILKMFSLVKRNFEVMFIFFIQTEYSRGLAGKRRV